MPKVARSWGKGWRRASCRFDDRSQLGRNYDGDAFNSWSVVQLSSAICRIEYIVIVISVTVIPSRSSRKEPHNLMTISWHVQLFTRLIYRNSASHVELRARKGNS